MPRLRAGGHDLDHVWIGPPPEAAPTLVFLHEGLGCVSLWRDFPARAAAATGWGALVYSRWGYGRSDAIAEARPVRFMHDEGLTTLPQVLAAAHVRDAVLVGHSDGGSIALIFAGAPDAIQASGARLRGVVTLAAHVFNEETSVRSIAAARTAYETTDLPERLRRHHGDNTEGAFRGWNDIWLDPDFRAWTIAEYLPRITCPVLAIQGADDEYGSARQLTAIADGVAGAVETLMLPDCGHAAFRDQPEATLAVLTRFVGALPGAVAA